MGAARPQRAGETENATGQFATSAENRSGLKACLFSLVFTLSKKWMSSCLEDIARGGMSSARYQIH
jgi:hypothetical protein